MSVISQVLAVLAEGQFSPGEPRPRRRVDRAGGQESGKEPQQLEGRHDDHGRGPWRRSLLGGRAYHSHVRQLSSYLDGRKVMQHELAGFGVGMGAGLTAVPVI